jgi:hypothetical protein
MAALEHTAGQPSASSVIRQPLEELAIFKMRNILQGIMRSPKRE